MIFRKKAHKQRGDTLVEVLLAMTVIGFVVGGAFGLASRAVRTGQAAQERTEALKVAESQLELTKAHLRVTGNNITTFVSSGTEFCIDPGQPAASAALDATLGSTPCDGVDGQGGSGLFDIRITEDSRLFTIRVTWERINTESSEPGLVELVYREGVL